MPLPLADADSPAVLELSTDPGRDHGALDPRDLVLEPDEGVILRLSQAWRRDPAPGWESLI